MPASLADSSASSCWSPGVSEVAYKSHTSVSSLSHSSRNALKERIAVAVRVRPLSYVERERGEVAAFGADGNSIHSGSDHYHYDHVFNEAASNEQVYEGVARDVVRTVVAGRSGAVLMYGATGSGKTWTMTGGPGEPGIVQRAITDLFTELPPGASPEEAPAVRMSILEVYNEELNDLLSLKGARLELRQATSGAGCHVAGLAQVPLMSAQHAMSSLATGIANRKVRSTAMNDASSRSHTIITFTVATYAPGVAADSQAPEEALDDVTTLQLVDLAGSESGRVTASRDGRRESAAINRSLLALGTVVSALSEGVASHVNFRDSKLTRLLQATLTEGGSRVAIICTATPAASQAHETRNTLEFGRRAKKVQIPKQSARPPSDREMVRLLQREIRDLRAQLASQNTQPITITECQLDAESEASQQCCHSPTEDTEQILPILVEPVSHREHSAGLCTPVRKAEGRSKHRRIDSTPEEAWVQSSGSGECCGECAREEDEVSSSQSEAATSAGLGSGRVSKLGSQIRQLQGPDMERAVDADLLSLIDALMEVMGKVRHVVEGRHKSLNSRGVKMGDVTLEE